MFSIWKDLRYAARSLSKQPGFLLTAVITLSLGIGATTAIFSVVYGTMLRPLPVPESGELVSIVSRTSQSRFYGTISYPDYLDYRNLKDVFEGLSVFAPTEIQLTARQTPERAAATLTNEDYFETLRLEAAIGRIYDSREGDVGGESVVVLSHGYWESRFGSDPSIVGGTVSLNGLPVTVVGVLPEEFPGTVGFISTQVYVPFSVWDQIRPGLGKQLEDRNSRSWRTVGRLVKGVSLESARAAVASRAVTLQQQYPQSNRDLRAFVFPEPMTHLEPAAAHYMPMVAPIFLGVVSLVLLIACANVANLLLVRATGRSREVAVRAALGAGRFRLIRQLLTESFLLSLLSGGLGLMIAQAVTVMLASVRVATDMPLFFDFSIDYRVFAFTALLTLGTGLVAGLAPGVSACRTNLIDALREGGRTGSNVSRQPLRSLLVVGQVSVSLVLLVSTGLFLKSFDNVFQVDPGFDKEDRLTLTIGTDLRNYEVEESRTFFNSLLPRIREIGGVQSAALAATLPVGYNQEITDVHLAGEGEGLTELEQEGRITLRNVVSADYFETMGVGLAEGRLLDRSDREDSRRVAVVNQRMAELYWPDRNAIGGRFSDSGPGGPFLHVVGIVENGFYILPGESPVPHYFVPLLQNDRRRMTLLVHSETPPEVLFPTLRREISSLDPDMPVFDVRTLKDHYEKGKAGLLFGVPAVLMAAFALIGTVLAVTGLYGVISYSVSQRTHEIGIRVALGATSARIIRMVSSRGLWLAGPGILLGLAGAWLVTRGFADLLVGVDASDPVIYASGSLLVLALSLLASFLPARLRASRIDPVRALRGDG